MLEAYFRQCRARDRTRPCGDGGDDGKPRRQSGDRESGRFTPYAVARTLSVMSSSGMYDYAGEWTYASAFPPRAASAAASRGAPIAAGIGTFSPLLDSHGNSVRGLKVARRFVAFRPAHP